MQLVYSTRVPVRLLKSFMLNHFGREQPRGARTHPVVKTLECYNDHITLFIVSVIFQTTANFSDTRTSTSTRIVERSPFISVVTFLL